MMENCHDSKNCAVFQTDFCMEILRLALDNLEKNEGDYFELIKNYILNYENADKKTMAKIRNVIVYLQNTNNLKNINRIIENLDKKLNYISTCCKNDIYNKLKYVCEKNSMKQIVNVILK